MPRKKHKPEEIIVKPRQIDVLGSPGQSVVEAVSNFATLSHISATMLTHG